MDEYVGMTKDDVLNTLMAAASLFRDVEVENSASTSEGGIRIKVIGGIGDKERCQIKETMLENGIPVAALATFGDSSEILELTVQRGFLSDENEPERLVPRM